MLFRSVDGAWYLEITPTYHFTWDGYRESWYYEDNLKGIKRLERNLAVLGQLLMWGDYLSRPDDLVTAPYPYLQFGALPTISIDWGIADQDWLGREEDASTRAATTETGDQRLLEETS